MTDGKSKSRSSATVFGMPRIAALFSASFLSLVMAGGWRHASAGEDEIPVLRKVEVVGGKTEAGDAAAVQAGGTINLEVVERPLKQVLDYLSNVSNKNIRVLKPRDEKLLVTFKLENVTYRSILDFIARKYGMVVDERDIKNNIIYMDTPEKVSMQFNRADIRDVINSIAIQSNANIVVGPEVTGEISMRLENVPWSDALNIVVRTLDFIAVPEANNTIRITSPAKISQQLDIRIFRLAYLSPEGNKYTAVLTSEFAKREKSKDSESVGLSLLDVLLKIKSPQGSITFEKQSNAVIARDTATTLDQIQSIIDKLDIAPKQVHCAVKLIELSDADTERIGVNWNQGIQFAMSPVSSWSSAFPFDVTNGISRSWLGDLSIATAPLRAIDPLTRTVVGTSDIFSLRKAVGKGATIADFDNISPQLALGSMGFRQTSALMEIFRTKTSGRVIQAPQIIALNNEEATIQVGELVRYAESFAAVTEGGGNISGFREAGGSPIKLGLQLLIIPHVTGPENNVLMTIIPKTENFSLARSGTGGAPPGFQRFIGPDGIQLDLPQTNQRIVVTKMMLRNGETGVIGGLREEREDLAETKVPVFGDIPFFGRLFKHKSQTSTGNNLLIFVTPTIVDLHESDTFKRDLDKLKQDLSRPFSTVGDEDEGP